jgi:transposase
MVAGIVTTAATETTADESMSVEQALRALLAARDDEAVLELFRKLQASHMTQLRSAIESARKQPTKNEGVTTEQLAMLFARLSEVTPSPSAADADEKLDDHVPPPPPAGARQPKHGPKRRPPRRRKLPELPVAPNLIEVPEAERPCPQCGRARCVVRHEMTSIIEIEPARVFIREDAREVRECPDCDGQTVSAPLGDKVIEGGAYGSNLVSDLIVGKYEDGLPLYRQHQRLLRLGLDMPLSSMGDQIAWAAELLAPVADALFEQMLSSQTMHLDGTSLPVLDRQHKKGIKTGVLWGFAGVNLDVDGDVCREERVGAFIYTPTGHARAVEQGYLGPADVLELRRARGLPHVVADAANLFDQAFAKPGLIEVGCNMHGRRYFAKALQAGDDRAARPIGAYKRLYDIEEGLACAPPDRKLEVRQRDSKPVFDALVQWAATYKTVEPPKSLLGRAVRYMVNHHLALGRFLQDGTLPIDNGIVERLNRRPAVGRRNYLFAGSDEGARRAAIAYTVLATCRLNDINALDYLADVLPRLARPLSRARDLPALMPLAWQRARVST